MGPITMNAQQLPPRLRFSRSERVSPRHPTKPARRESMRKPTDQVSHLRVRHPRAAHYSRVIGTSRGNLW